MTVYWNGTAAVSPTLTVIVPRKPKRRRYRGRHRA